MKRIIRKFRNVVILLVVIFTLTFLVSSYTQSQNKKVEGALEKNTVEAERFFVKYKKTSDNFIGMAEAKDKKNTWKLVKVSSPQEFEKLRNDPNIENIQPDFQRRLMTPNDSYYNSQNTTISGQYDQWNLRSIGLTPTSDPNSGWNITTGSVSTTVAVIDTGLALDNPDIGNGSNSTWAINNLWINQNEITNAQKTLIDTNVDSTVDSVELITYFRSNNLDVNADTKIDFRDVVAAGSPLRNNSDQDSNGIVDDLIGYNFADATPDSNDHDGHGTHVSGVIAASTNNNATVSVGVAGICWSCKVMPLKVVNDSGFAYDSDIVDAINYAVNKGAKVINMSLGGPGYSQPLQDAITNAWNSGVLVVAASGNYGGSASDSYPGGNTSALSVGALDYLDQITNYSNMGGKLDIVAPGDYILSTYVNSLGGCIGAGYYVCSSGTSMASPHVAGLAALLFDLHKSDSPAWTAREVRNALLNYTKELPTTQTARPGCVINVGDFDDCSGFGKLDAEASLNAPKIGTDSTPPTASLAAIPAEIGGNFNFTGTASDTNLYSYTLSFQRVSDSYIVKQETFRTSVTNSTLLSLNTSSIAEGNYAIVLRVEDFYGNVTSVTSNQFIVDNTSPTSFSLVTPANNSATNQSRPTFDWSASSDSNGVVYDFVLDGSLYASNIATNSFTLGSDLSEGGHTWSVTAKDPAGNSISTSPFSFIEDRTPPNNFVVNSSISGSAPTFTFAATDSLSGILSYQGSLDGGGFVTITSPYSPGNLSDGTHSFVVRAFDKAGNTRDSSINVSISSRCAFLKSKGDYNCDGAVEISDFSILAFWWNKSNSVADSNGDNFTEISDFSILAFNWQKNF